MNKEAMKLKQEPVAWIDIDENDVHSGLRYWSEPDNPHQVALCKCSPLQRTWVGLTEDEVTLCHSLAVLSKKHDGTDPSFTTLLHQQIETKLKEKNT